jgi:hypothetical protein
MGVSRISGWSKKIIIIIGGLSEAKKNFGIKISCKNRIFSICRGAYAPNPRLTSNPYIY